MFYAVIDAFTYPLPTYTNNLPSTEERVAELATLFPHTIYLHIPS